MQYTSDNLNNAINKIVFCDLFRNVSLNLSGSRFFSNDEFSISLIILSKLTETRNRRVQ